MKKASDEVGIYTSEKRASKNIGIATEIASISVSVVKLLVLPVSGIVSTSDLYLTDAVLRSRSMLIMAKVDLAFPKTLPQPVISPSYRFLSQSYNYFRYPSANLEFWVKEASDEVGIYTSEKVVPQNIGMATEISSVLLPLLSY